MITYTTLHISINGNDIPGCMSLELEQAIHGHHSFRAQFPGIGLENDPLGLGEDSLKKIGMPVKIGFSNTAGHKMVFNGVITSVNAKGSHQSGQGQIIIFEGYSSTILLENGSTCRSFNDMSLSQIIKKVSAAIDSNSLKVVAQPLNDVKQHYTVQYDESIFSFINRLAKRFGEWCYYDGIDLIIGNKKQSTIDLNYGSDLYSFSVNMQAPAVHRHYVAHSYKGDDTNTINTKDKKPSLQGSVNDIYNLAHKMWQSPEPAISIQFDDKNGLKKQMDDLGKVNTEGIASNMFYFKGESINPSLFPGEFINIKGSQQHSYGTFILISVTHNYKVGGEYINNFIAIPSSLKLSPYTDVNALPYCETQAGVVTDNNDPDGLGRVKVKLYWQKDSETPWLRLTTPYAGSDKGMYFIPEIGEEVMVGFEGGIAEKPYVIGSLYHGKMKPDSFSNADNDIKAIKSRSGHIIELNDKDGSESIKITDKNGNMLIFDTAGKNILISSKNSININSENSILLSGKSIVINATEDLNLSGANSAGLGSDKNVMIQGQTVDLSAQNSFTLASQNQVNITGMITNVTGSTSINLN